MRFHSIVLTSCLALLTGCATNANSDQASRFESLDMSTTPAYIELDQQLDAMEKETNEIEQDYQKIEAQVVSRINFEHETPDDNLPLKVQLTASNVILVDANALSKNDFITFADQHLPTRCASAPTLIIDNGADYNIAAWILEAFYAHGCMDVTISE